MEDYIQEALKQGFIQPSTSPATSSIFFVAKKCGGLRTCIDYRHLNSQMVKYSYPLRLCPGRSSVDWYLLQAGPAEPIRPYSYKQRR